MIEDLELILAIAEITGVFIGFGALISVSRPKDLNSRQILQIQGVSTVGLMIFVGALFPLILSRYNITGHTLWFTSSVVYLSLNILGIIIGFRAAENRRFMVEETRANPSRTLFFWLILEVCVQGPLILTIIGLFPDLEPAFFITSLVASLFEAVFILTQIVHANIEPSSTDHPPHPIHA